MKRLLPLLLLAACNGGVDADPVVTPTKFDEATLRSVRGRALFKGERPRPVRLPMGGNAECAALHPGDVYDEDIVVKDGALANVFVRVTSGLDKAWVFDWPRTPVTVANSRCIYAPRVAGAQVHQPITFRNDDVADHNIHGFYSKGEFNFTLRARGQERFVKMRSPEVMLTVRCDLHPWMIGHVGVVDHPFFAVTGPDGAFELKRLPPGTYTVEAWHEKLGTRSAPVTVAREDVSGVEFVFEPK